MFLLVWFVILETNIHLLMEANRKHKDEFELISLAAGSFTLCVNCCNIYDSTQKYLF